MSPPRKPPHENYKISQWMVPVLVRLFLESDLWVFIMPTMWRLFFQNYLNILLSGNQMPRMGLDFTYIFETRLFLLFCLILREGNSWTTLPGSIVDYQHPSILVYLWGELLDFPFILDCGCVQGRPGGAVHEPGRGDPAPLLHRPHHQVSSSPSSVSVWSCWLHRTHENP
jgi:hypothetical protein